MKRMLLALALSLSLLAVMVWLLHPADSPVPTPSVLSVQSVQSALLDFGSQRVAWFELNATPFDATSVNVTWNVWPQPISESVFWVQSPSVEASGMDRFQAALDSELALHGKRVQSVSAKEVWALPAHSLIVLASGAISQQWLKQGTLLHLIGQNDTVLFMGMAFDFSMDADGTLAQDSALSKNASDSLGFAYADADRMAPRRHGLVFSQYGIRLTGRNQTRLVVQDQTVYAVQYQNRGTLAFIPNTLDRGWTSPEKAARDFSQIILNGEWQPYLAQERKVVVLQPGLNDFFSPSFSESFAFARLDLSWQNQSFSFSRFLHSLPGKMESQPVLDPGQNVSLSVTLNEKAVHSRSLHLTVVAFRRGKPFFEKPVGTIEIKNLGLLSTSFFENWTPGDYLLQLKDDQENVHALSALHVRNSSVEFLREDYASGSFEVRILNDGQPLANSLLQLSFDGGKNKTVATDEQGLASFNLPMRPSSMHVFLIQTPLNALILFRTPSDPSVFSNPFGVLAVLVALVLFTVGYVVGYKPRAYVWVDIPDFMPDDGLAYSVTSSTVMDAFERGRKIFGRVSALTLDEITHALSEILGLTSRQCLNPAQLDAILLKLQEKKRVKKAFDRYALCRWQHFGRPSAEWLCLKRRITDALVEAGCRFVEKTDRIQTAHADFIPFAFPMPLQRAAGVVGRRKKFLVFGSSDDCQSWIQRLKHDSSAESICLYLHIRTGQLIPIALDQLACEGFA